MNNCKINDERSSSQKIPNRVPSVFEIAFIASNLIRNGYGTPEGSASEERKKLVADGTSLALELWISADEQVTLIRDRRPADIEESIRQSELEANDDGPLDPETAGMQDFGMQWGFVKDREEYSRSGKVPWKFMVEVFSRKLGKENGEERLKQCLADFLAFPKDLSEAKMVQVKRKGLDTPIFLKFCGEFYGILDRLTKAETGARMRELGKRSGESRKLESKGK